MSPQPQIVNAKPGPRLFTPGPILFLLLFHSEWFLSTPESVLPCRDMVKRRRNSHWSVFSFLWTFPSSLSLPNKKNVFCSWGSCRQLPRLLFSLFPSRSRKTGWLWGLLLVEVLRVYVVLVDEWLMDSVGLFQ